MSAVVILEHLLDACAVLILPIPNVKYVFMYDLGNNTEKLLM